MGKRVRERKKQIKTRAASLFLALVMALSPSLTSVAADEDLGNNTSKPVSSNAITYEYYTQDLGNTVPVSWLFVGTYLMSAKAVTAQIYQSALESRETYNQYIAYYRSELDGAQWKNIKDSSSIDVILPSSENVEEKELFPYLITAVVGDDGIPRDPVTGEPIDIFKMVSIYDMENIPELDAIEEYYNSGKVSWQDKGSKNYLYRMLYFFFENDTLDFDRDALDTTKLKQQYADLSADKTALEDRWDESLSRAPEVYPEEYKEIMTLMRNWPNIQDAVTQKSDKEMDKIHQMFLELFEKEMSEEADSALLVERQLDALRRSEIYFNLTSNDKLAGNSDVQEQEFEDETALRKAEVTSLLALLASEIDKEQAVIDSLSEKLASIEEAGAELDSKINEENESFKELNPEEKKKELSAELEKLNEEFAPVKEQYEKLDQEIDDLIDTADALGAQIDALKKEKQKKQEDYLKTKADMQARINELAKKIEYAKEAKDNLQGYKDELAKTKLYLENLTVTLGKEKTRYDQLAADADTYTGSRFTSVFDSSKTYDPEKKRETDRALEKQEDILEELNLLIAAAEEKIKSLGDLIDSINEGLNAESELKQLEEEYAKHLTEGKDTLNAELEELDKQIEAKEKELIKGTDGSDDGLEKLKEAVDDLNAISDEYKEKKNEIEDKSAQLEELDKAQGKHDDKIAALNQKKQDNEKRAEGKKNCINSAKSFMEELSKKADILQEELEKIGVYEDSEGYTPYTNLINLLNIEEESIKKQIKANESIADTHEKMQAELFKSEAETSTQISENAKAKLPEDKLLSEELKDITKIKTVSSEVAGNVVSTTQKLEDRLPEIQALLKEYQEKSASYLKADKLSFAPTLYFLRDAAANGAPAYGRQFKNISLYSGETFEEDPDFTEIIENAINECVSKHTEYEKKSLRRGETGADYVKYLLSRAVAAKAPDIDACLPYLQMLTDLTNINAGEAPVHNRRELDLLYGWLLPFSMSDFNDFRTEESRYDYQFYIKALSDRESVGNAISYVEDRLEYAYGLRNSFLASGDGKVIESHIDWLDDLLRSLKERADEDEGDEEEDELSGDLEEALKRAVEEDDLVRAKKIEALLKMLADAQKAEGDGKGGRDEGETDLDEENALKNRPSPESEIMDAMLDSKDSDGYDVKDDIDKLASVMPDLGEAEKVIKEFGDDALDYAKRTQGKNDVPPGGKPGDDDDGDSLWTEKDISAADAERLLGDKFKNGNDAEKAAMVAYLADLTAGDTDSELYQYMKKLLDELLKNKNACIYRQYLDDRGVEYVSLAAMDACRPYCGFRYVREENSPVITMSQVNGGSASYSFTVGDEHVLTNDKSSDEMSRVAGEQTDSYVRVGSNEKYGYICEDYAKTHLGCGCAYVENTDWAILITPGMDSIISEIAKILSENAKKE